MDLTKTIAPAHLIIDDYLSLLDQVKLRMGSKYKKLLLMQTVIGHAQSGHAEFHGKIYENTTLDDVVDALASSNNKKISQGLGKISKKRIKKLRDEVLEMLKSPFERIIEGENITSLTDKEGNPLLGIPTLKKAEIKNKEAFFIGGYLASKMDSYEWREKLSEDERYNAKMGGGECVAVDIEELTKYNLTLNDISNSEWGKALKLFEETGVIIDLDKKKGKRIESTDNIKNAYIRHKIGRGVSDDAAVIIAGRLYGEEAFWGAYLLDAIDTWDKYTTYIVKGGEDEYFGEELKKHINLTNEELEEKTLEFIALSRKGKNFPDSSQRYFLEIDESVDQTALESHLKFIRGENFKEMGVGYRKRGERIIDNTSFYKSLNYRLQKEN